MQASMESVRRYKSVKLVLGKPVDSVTVSFHASRSCCWEWCCPSTNRATFTRVGDQLLFSQNRKSPQAIKNLMWSPEDATIGESGWIAMPDIDLMILPADDADEDLLDILSNLRGLAEALNINCNIGEEIRIFVGNSEPIVEGVAWRGDATMEFCLEEELPFGGMFFTEHQSLSEDDSEAKSWGFRWGAAKLDFHPDGRVVGTFLHALEDREDGEPYLVNSHLSNWQGRYLVYPTGAVRLYDFADSEDVDIDFVEHEKRVRRLRGLGGLERLFIGVGSERDRVQAAQAIAEPFVNAKSVFHQIALGQLASWTMRECFLDKLASWKKCQSVQVVWTVSIALQGDIATVTCTNLAADETCSLTIPTSTRLGDLYTLIQQQAHTSTPLKLLLPDGRELLDDMRETAFLQVKLAQAQERMLREKNASESDDLAGSCASFGASIASSEQGVCEPSNKIKMNQEVFDGIRRKNNDSEKKLAAADAPIVPSHDSIPECRPRKARSRYNKIPM